MGSLLTSRVNVSRLFSHCGIDYIGPFLLHEGMHQNAQSHKSYVSLYVLRHEGNPELELVNDFTSEAFIATFSFRVGVDPRICIWIREPPS